MVGVGANLTRVQAVSQTQQNCALMLLWRGFFFGGWVSAELDGERHHGGGKNGEKGGPGGRSVDGCLLWFLCSSQICVPPYSFLKEGF